MLSDLGQGDHAMAGEKDTWELIVDKAKGLLHSNGVDVAQQTETSSLRALLSEL